MRRTHQLARARPRLVSSRPACRKSWRCTSTREALVPTVRDDRKPPAPFHVTRVFAGPNLLAMLLFEKFGQHQPLNRQSERYARDGVDLSRSTLADQVGACATVLRIHPARAA